MKTALFWSLFIQEKELLLVCAPMAAVDRIHQLLETIDHRLSVEVSDDDGNRNVIFSANGFRELIPFVEKIVDHAPKVSNFCFHAFKVARGFEFVFRNQDTEINPIEWTFAPLRDNSGALAILINTNSESIEKSVVGVIVETGIGERVFTELANWFVATEDDIRSNNQWLPIKSLSSFLEWSANKVPVRGNYS